MPPQGESWASHVPFALQQTGASEGAGILLSLLAGLYVSKLDKACLLFLFCYCVLLFLHTLVLS